jgi:histidyl-tRNA synthetase
MAVQKPSIPKGTRDFSPEEMVRREYIFNTIKDVFKLYGFQPLETPSMENLTTLTGKYGDEGDQLIFKILNSGNFLDGVDQNLFSEPKKLAGKIAEKALRYDLTVPFARYVVMNQHAITFPFKRYQVQPVWRADRPQKGRYREFYQCDADVIGSNSLLNEVELIQIFDEVFSRLSVPSVIKINNRKVLVAIAEVIGKKDDFITLTVAIDKLDKIGVDGVLKELSEKGFDNDALESIKPLLSFTGDLSAKISMLEKLIGSNEIGKKGIEELHYIVGRTGSLKQCKLELDITLARGLNYYTGTIFEVKADAGTLTSSICGGGRYDDLTGIFGLPGISGVGISFGADRIYDVINELNLFPEALLSSTKLLFVNFGPEEEKFCFEILGKLREAGIASEIYPDTGVKMKKQMTYADNKKIPYVALVGSEEMKQNKITLKNMSSGEQKSVSVTELINELK